MNFDFVVIDSGFDLRSDSLFNCTGILCEYLPSNSTVPICDDVDVYGHGTTVINMIKKEHPDATILSLRIFDDEDGIVSSSEGRLIEALRYIDRNHTAKVINMSCDIIEPTRIEELSDITYNLAKKGVVLVAAHQNQGGFSYPASFRWVVGVADDAFRPLNKKMTFCRDTRINIFDSVKFVRLLGNKSKNKVTYGCSFSCAYVSAIIFSYINKGAKNIDDVLLFLERDYPPQEEVIPVKPLTPKYHIKKAVIFPFNKEAHSIVRFAKDLLFELVDVYDIKELMQIGKSTQEVLDDPNVPYYIIKNIKNIDWSSFDTLIIGCLGEIKDLLHNDDWVQGLINDAIQQNKNIYAFEEIDVKNQLIDSKIFYPRIRKEDIPSSLGFRLFHTAIPVIGIYGTSSKQGKLTLQMVLRKEFQKIGCRVGQIGSEPSSLLLGMDYMFPMGYNSNIDVDESEKILYVNNLLWKVAEKKPDIIITGSQMGTVPYRFENLMHYCYQTYAFLQGTKPDYAIVTVSLSDSIEYIRRTIHFLDSLTKTKTLALVLFPLCNYDDNRKTTPIRRRVSQDEYLDFKEIITKEFNIPVLLLGSDSLPEDLMSVVLSEFE